MYSYLRLEDLVREAKEFKGEKVMDLRVLKGICLVDTFPELLDVFYYRRLKHFKIVVSFVEVSQSKN